MKVQTRCETRQSVVGLALLVALAFVALAPTVAFAETYAHGFLRYELVDGTVVITGYEGREAAVSVPAMIGGNPVSAVAAGAFADAPGVEAVYLPDTVTSVEQGAFSTGQAVVLGGSSAGDDDSGDDAGSGEEAGEVASGGDADGGSEQQGGSGSQSGSGSSASTTPVGITTSNGSFVTVDNDGNLVMVDSSGTERVLDSSQKYTVSQKKNGQTVIKSASGSTVAVSDGSKVSFEDAEGREVVVDEAKKSTTIKSKKDKKDAKDGEDAEALEDSDEEEALTYAIEEAEIDEETLEAVEAEGKAAGTPTAVIAAVVAVVMAAAAAAYVWWKKKSQ